MSDETHYEGDGHQHALRNGDRWVLASLDLHDPETANLVADAIVRFHGDFVPLSERYPWEFRKPAPGRCGDRCPGVDLPLVCELRAGHTGQHEGSIPEGHGYWDQITDDALVRVTVDEMLDEATAEVRRLTLLLEQISAVISDAETLSPGGMTRELADQIRALLIGGQPS